MACVNSVKYNVRLNGALSDSCAPTRGLRRGDPVSLLLFLFVADGLDAILKQKVMHSMISPIHVCPWAPGISDLLFTDDMRLFFWATQDEAAQVRDSLAM